MSVKTPVGTRVQLPWFSFKAQVLHNKKSAGLRKGVLRVLEEDLWRRNRALKTCCGHRGVIWPGLLCHDTVATTIGRSRTI